MSKKEEKTEELQEFYSVNVLCINCGRYEYKENIPKGEPLSEQECSYCGCKTLSKSSL